MSKADEKDSLLNWKHLLFSYSGSVVESWHSHSPIASIGGWLYMYNKIQFGLKGFASNQETLSCVIPINYYKQNKCIVFNWLNFGFRTAFTINEYRMVVA